MKLAKHSRLYIANGAALFLGTVNDTEFHRHNMLQITRASEGEFTIEVGGEVISAMSVVLDSNCRHRLTGEDGIQAVLLIEPETRAGTLLREYLGDRQFCIPDPGVDIFGLMEYMPARDPSISFLVNSLLSRLNINIDARTVTDSRIERVIDIIKDTDGKKISIKALALSISLSESRLQHIFKGRTGISIKKYLQWKRLIDGVNAIIKGNDFTFAAHEAGFADSAHMSRTFKEMFGINLTDIFHRSRSVQVIICKN